MSDQRRRVGVLAAGAVSIAMLASPVASFAQDEASPAQISLAKWNNVDTALEIARECRDMLGAAGITTEHCSMRHMLNLETVATYEGTRTIHELVVGRLLTGHAAF